MTYWRTGSGIGLACLRHRHSSYPASAELLAHLRQRGLYLAAAAALDHRLAEGGGALPHAPVDGGDGGDDLAVAAEQRVAEFENAQIGPRTRPDYRDRLQDGAGRRARPGLRQERRHRGGRGRYPGIAVDQQMRVGRTDQLAAERQQALD